MLLTLYFLNELASNLHQRARQFSNSHKSTMATQRKHVRTLSDEDVHVVFRVSARKRMRSLFLF